MNWIKINKIPCIQRYKFCITKFLPACKIFANNIVGHLELCFLLKHVRMAINFLDSHILSSSRCKVYQWPIKVRSRMKCLILWQQFIWLDGNIVFVKIYWRLWGCLFAPYFSAELLRGIFASEIQQHNTCFIYCIHAT